MTPARARHAAASILEITIAIVILGVIAALAIPRFSRAESSGGDVELRARLQVVRTAIELYHRDHGHYPGRSGSAADLPAAVDSASAEALLLAQLRPYLRDGFPRSPLRARPGPTRIHVVTGGVGGAVETVDADWVYNADTGEIFANSPRTDGLGQRYDRY
ncbi:MAG: hypothetical protein AMXMBFR47_31320 [Planctomycetota bacterium]